MDSVKENKEIQNLRKENSKHLKTINELKFKRAISLNYFKTGKQLKLQKKKYLIWKAIQIKKNFRTCGKKT